MRLNSVQKGANIVWSFSKFLILTKKARISPIRNVGNNCTNQLLGVGILQSWKFHDGLGP